MAAHFRLSLFVLLALVTFGLGGARDARAVSLETIYSFCTDFVSPNCIDGETPTSRLLQVGAAYYGTASTGGLAKFHYSTTSKAGYGILFKVSSSGAYTTVYDFCQQTDCSDGASPGNLLTLGTHGEIYGTTFSGGKVSGGTIFKLVDGKLSTLYRFCAKPACADGIQPVSVALDRSGALFGTTTAGGKYGGGIAFTLDAGGVLHVLHSFCAAPNCADGATPGALILGKDGNFYGTTVAGGKNQGGTVFRLTPAGVLTRLYSLCAQKQCADGEQPNAVLTEGTDGNFYGTAVLGGAHRSGAVFRVTPTGTWDVIHSFCASAYCDDGSSPLDGLTLAKDGTFYGTANGGGRFYHGLVFHMTRGGVYGILHEFCTSHGCFDGAGPSASPTVGTDGFLYGTTSAGGEKDNVGAIYRIDP